MDGNRLVGDGLGWIRMVYCNSTMCWLFRSVNLSWAVPGNNNSPITAYIIAYKKYLGNKNFLIHSVIYISGTRKKVKPALDEQFIKYTYMK
jgi:hypothetical protein